MSICYICNEIILSNNTYNEHIILNAIGGVLKSKDLICHKCSPKLDSIDTALAKYLQPITCLLNIERDRGNKKIPPIEGTRVDTGEKIYLEAGGKPVIPQQAPKKIDDGYCIRGKSLPEIKNTLEGLKKKNEWIDVEKTVSNTRDKIANQEISTSKFIDSPIAFSFNIETDNFFRAICKMAISFYQYKGGDRKNVAHLINYICNQDNENNQYCGWFYLDNNDNLNLLQKQEKITHTIIVKGNKKYQCLYAIVLLYGAFQFIVCLSDNYQGENIDDSYVYDVIDKNIINVENIINLDLDISKLTIKNIIKNDQEKYTKIAAERAIFLFDLIQKQHGLGYLQTSSLNIIESNFDNLPEGETISKEFLSTLAGDIASNIMEISSRINDVNSQKNMLRKNP